LEKKIKQLEDAEVERKQHLETQLGKIEALVNLRVQL